MSAPDFTLWQLAGILTIRAKGPRSVNFNFDNDTLVKMSSARYYGGSRTIKSSPSMPVQSSAYDSNWTSQSCRSRSY